MLNSEEPFIDFVRQKLAAAGPTGDLPIQAKPAAVLLPLYWDQGEWNLLYTRRTDSVESHKGQVSFPGGAVENEDNSPQQTALREVFEEIGIQGKDIEILGSFDRMLTISKFAVTPFVGRIPWPYELQINRAEVATAFGAPLSWLLEPGNLTTEDRHIPAFDLTVPVYFFKPLQDEIIWGATAAITVRFLKLIGLMPEN